MTNAPIQDTPTKRAADAEAGVDDAVSRESTPLIELRDLGVWFRLHTQKGLTFRQMLLRGWKRQPKRRLWALRHVDLTCHEGQTLGIIGPNGAGKSTLCLVLSGILAPDEGTAAIRGNVAALLTLGAGFTQDLTGRANILLNAAFLGISRAEAERRMDDIIAFSELEDFIDEPVRTYSSGMKARLGFSVAQALEPEIMILDEVLSVGDQAFREKSKNRIHEMMRTSRLIVIVSHSAGFLRNTCSHCLWLDKGEAKMFGPAPEVITAYSEHVKHAQP